MTQPITLFTQKPGIDPDDLPPDARTILYAIMDDLREQMGSPTSRKEFRRGMIELIKHGFCRLVQTEDGHIHLELAPGVRPN